MKPTALLVAGDPDQPTGGYRYDARIVAGLRELGRPVTVIGLDGRFPEADMRARHALDTALAARPDDSIAVIDGLVLGALPDVAQRHAGRLTLIALIHHPLADEAGLDATTRHRLATSERLALAAVAAIIVTSAFTARRLDAYGVRRDRPHVVEPGVDPAMPAQVANPPTRLLCIASCIPRKGHDVLIKGLAAVDDLDWRCDCIGALDRTPTHSGAIRRAIAERGLGERVHLHGTRAAHELQAAYAGADLFVLPSYYEGYGMVVTEALARGLPVITTNGGALADTLPDRAGIKLSPGDPVALATALRAVMTQPQLYRDLRRGALEVRATLGDWDRAAAAFDRVLSGYDAPSRGTNIDDCAHFADDWLALREPLDHHHRALQMARATARHLEQVAPQRQAVDLGSGSGSNLRYLGPRLPVTRWRLVDHDRELLAIAKTRCAGLCNAQGRPIEIDTRLSDLDRRSDLDDALGNTLDGAALVTAAALLDLVSIDWLWQLIAACAERGAALLCVLNVDGRIAFRGTTDDDDTRVLAALQVHQHRDKGLGPALGTDAPGRLLDTLSAHGYTATSAHSDWLLDLRTADLATRLIAGWAEAATAVTPDDAALIDAWRRRRTADLTTGSATLMVGHTDILGLPPAE